MKFSLTRTFVHPLVKQLSDCLNQQAGKTALIPPAGEDFSPLYLWERVGVRVVLTCF